MKESRPKGQIPCGFKMNLFGQLIPDNVEQRVVSRMKELRTKGRSLRAIAVFLNDSEIPAKNGGIWQANTVSKITSNI